ncbi:hypothetical protein K505DRAFT_340329 [Melanomma pulvis-pyrius CBS 109.77]|uniref:Uncharacterized protein n=1 Tax=Melanomma pulvis-pyrius CBS 109.77 TaxID=1314802 RepID=A0A6A6X2H0_9PLEO|nr:hypothetical protein K505DRAFT_340329 [Melanomma pulvis-pyrius CBS 109.77]
MAQHLPRYNPRAPQFVPSSSLASRPIASKSQLHLLPGTQPSTQKPYPEPKKRDRFTLWLPAIPSMEMACIPQRAEQMAPTRRESSYTIRYCWICLEHYRFYLCCPDISHHHCRERCIKVYGSSSNKHLICEALRCAGYIAGSKVTLKDTPKRIEMPEPTPRSIEIEQPSHRSMMKHSTFEPTITHDPTGSLSAVEKPNPSLMSIYEPIWNPTAMKNAATSPVETESLNSNSTTAGTPTSNPTATKTSISNSTTTKESTPDPTVTGNSISGSPAAKEPSPKPPPRRIFSYAAVLKGAI